MREKILAMGPGWKLDALVAEIMEPKPANTKTYRQLEEEDRAKPNGGSYGCWSIESPGGWWELNIDWGDVSRDGRVDHIPDWTPAKEPSEDISAAWEVVEQFKWYKITNGEAANPTMVMVTLGRPQKKAMAISGYAEAPTVPEAICKAALLAVMEG